MSDINPKFNRVIAASKGKGRFETCGPLGGSSGLVSLMHEHMTVLRDSVIFDMKAIIQSWTPHIHTGTMVIARSIVADTVSFQLLDIVPARRLLK